jgi:hypothetical protein
MHATARRTTGNFAAAAITATALLAALAQPAAAGPRPEPSNRTGHHLSPASVTCTDGLRDLTQQFRAAGFTGQASHVAAELTLGC